MSSWFCEFTPENRLKALVEYLGPMAMNPTVTTKLYYKSGLNMYKQFLNYYKVIVAQPGQINAVIFVFFFSTGR